jgi:histidinol dehydrogenase
MMSPATPIKLPVALGNQAAGQWVTQHTSQSGWLPADAAHARERTHACEAIEDIITQVAKRGDEALRELADTFGDKLPHNQPIALPHGEWERQIAQVPEPTRAIIDAAASNIETFAQHVMATLPTQSGYEHHGYHVGFRLQPVQSVGCYVPGGRYPLVSTALMTALTAKAAGVPHIALCCPKPTPELLYAAQRAGATTFYSLGGAQAIAALALGTASVKPVAMICGPGNRYVTEAKRLLAGTHVGIDMLAGPSEVVILADETAPAEWVSADLLAQAEHDPDACAILITTSEALAKQVQALLPKQINAWGLPAFVSQESLPHSAILVVEDWDMACQLANRLAPEHLHLAVANPEALQPKLKHYGTLFNGTHNTVAYGDYAAGPNHTLPTGRSARFASALSPLAFLRLQNHISVEQPNPTLAKLTTQLAGLEGLTAHGESALLRLQ